MTAILLYMLTNGLIVVPIAVIVAVCARWLNRPALVHALWIIVLLKLVSPTFYAIHMPGLGEIVRHLLPDASLALAFDGVESPLEIGEECSAAPVAWRGVERATQLRPRSIHTSSHGESVVGANTLAVAASSLPSSSDKALLPAQFGVLTTIVVGAWLLGAVTFFCVLGYRVRRFQQLVKRAPCASESVQGLARSIAVRYDLRTTPTIRVASGDFPPLLWVMPGSTSIVLPQKLLLQLGPPATENLLAHELAHFARGDQWVRLLESIVLGIYWWHPLVWWTRRQLQHAEELCCDAWVLWAYPKSNTAYARTLLATLEYLSGARSTLPPLASGLGRTSLIRRRFEMILHQKSPRRLSAIGMATTATVALAVLPWSAVVFAQPQKDAVVVEFESGSEKDSTNDIESRDRQAARTKRSAPAESRKEKGAIGESAARSASIDHVNSVDLQRLIRSAIHYALREARGGLQHAEWNSAKHIHVDASRSFDGPSNMDWLPSMLSIVSALDNISEEEVHVIAEHIEIAVKHFGVAMERSAEAFLSVMDRELETLEQAIDEEGGDGHDSYDDPRASVLKAIESGLSEKELLRLVRAVHDALERADSGIALHLTTESSDGSVKPQESTDGTPRKSHPHGGQVEAILRRIKSLVKQLEQRLKVDADATGTFR